MVTQIDNAHADDWPWLLERSPPIGGPEVVSRGSLWRLRDHPALIARNEGQRCGFLVYRPCLPDLEVLALLAVDRLRGAGSTLMAHLEDSAPSLGVRRIWLCTTNDNLEAMRFYQRRGYRLLDAQPGAFSTVKSLKGITPEQTILGNHGIEIRDELRFGKTLT